MVFAAILAAQCWPEPIHFARHADVSPKSQFFVATACCFPASDGNVTEQVTRKENVSPRAASGESLGGVAMKHGGCCVWVSLNSRACLSGDACMYVSRMCLLCLDFTLVPACTPYQHPSGDAICSLLISVGGLSTRLLHLRGMSRGAVTVLH